MWLKTRKMNALLEQLGPVVDGKSSRCRLTGSYHGYAVEARPHSAYPIKYISSVSYGSVGPEPVNMLRVVLVGVRGSQTWRCQSSASSYRQDIASRFTAGPALEHFKPGEFKFEGVDTLTDAIERMGEKFVERLGMPLEANADRALQARLIAAGLFGALDALRMGAHPYLPKVAFFPGARELAELATGFTIFARGRPAVEARLRAAGLPDYQSLIKAKMNEIEGKNPGRLELDVEAGKAKVPEAEEFRHLLEHAVRIAEINAKVNTPAELA